MELIQEWFDKTKQIIAAHVDELTHTPVCSGDKAAQVRALYDKINVHVRGLNSVGMEPHDYGKFLIPVIMSKLLQDVNLRLQELHQGICRTLKNCCK